MKFKVGDRVREVDGFRWPEEIATVIKVDDLYGDVEVEFDNYNERRHNLNGECEYGYGWFYSEFMVELAEIKVKPTRLAKKMYPNSKEEDGYLIIEA